jgi:peptide/nickel transport system substrate-binding protein
MPSRRDPSTLIVGRAADAIGLDPATLTDNESVETCEQIFEHLVRYAPGSTEVEPALATRWAVSEDGREWTFELRPGVSFHDGTPLDAEAVVFSFERQRDPRHPFHRDDFTYWQSSFPYLERIEAIGPLTVRITIERPYAPFLTSLAIFPVSIVSPTAVKRWGREFTRHPVGTGPYRFQEWHPGDRIVLERNEAYWGPKAKLERLVFRYIPDPRQRLVALEGGAVDVAYGILPEELQFVELHPDLELAKIAGQNVAYLAMNTQRRPLQDLELRRAVNHAINKVPIVKLVYQGLAVPASGPLPPTMWSWRGDVIDYPYDPDRARNLVEEAARRGAFDPAQRLRFYVPGQARTYLPNPDQVARVIQRNLADVGIGTELVVQDFVSHLDAVQEGKHDLCLLGWQGDTGDPDNFLYVLLDRSNTTPGNARNVAFYRNAELHGLLTHAQESHDRGERESLYRRAQEIIAREAPWVPLAHNQITVAARDDVEGLTLHPSALIRYEAVWLDR